MFGNATSSPFGQKPATTGPTGFGTGLTQPTFGSPGASAFGAPQQSAFGQGSANLSFGQTTTAPAFGQTNTTPGFGQAPTTSVFGQSNPTPGFGTPSTQSSFGTPTSTPAFGSTAPSFGNTTLSFGGNQQKTGFGATTSQAPLSFGTATPTATTTQASGFSFGTNLGQTGFGTPTATTTASTLTLGTTTAAQAPLTFSTPQTTSGLTFGTAKPAAISFGTPTTTQSSLTFGTSITTKPSTTQPGFMFGTATSTTTAPVTTSSQLSSSGLSSFTSGSLLGSAIGGKSILTITGNTATPLYSNKTADLQAGRSPGQTLPKCQPVHPLVLELVESFKNHIKEQKHLCLEVSRASLKPINKISNDAESIKRSVMKLERAVNKNKILNSKLKEETLKALADVESAQKAMDYPGGFPCDNSIITDYFLQLANKFQQQVLGLRVELESTEKSILCELNPVAFTPQELSATMQRLYECFVALAGRFQLVHAQISNLKVQHLELRRKKLEDYTDIFSRKHITPSVKPSIRLPMVADVPTSFSGFRALSVKGNLSKQFVDSTAPALPQTLTSNLFASPLMNQTLQNNNVLSTSPQLSAPGSKRGKR